jgi:hypothetical protein
MDQNSQGIGWPIVGVAIIAMAVFVGASLVRQWRTPATRGPSADTGDQVVDNAVGAMIDEGAPAGGGV